MTLRAFSVAFASSLFGATLAAQTPPCISANDSNNNSSAAVTAFSFAGPNGFGWQFSPTQTMVLLSAEIFTENAFLTNRGYMSVEIWDTNFIFQPGQRLGGGSFAVGAALGHDWHGANFDQPVTLMAGQTYWFVWIEPGFSAFPTEPGGVATTTVIRSGTGWATQATSQAPKWRGYCNLLDEAGVAPVGFGCTTSSGSLPGLFTNHAPAVGNTDFQLEASGFPAGTIGLVILGTNPAFVNVPVPGAMGCMLHTDPLVTLTVSTGTGDEGANHLPSGPGFSGHCTFPLGIPNNPALTGMIIGSQFAMLDVAIGTPLPLVFSNGLQITIQ